MNFNNIINSKNNQLCINLGFLLIICLLCYHIFYRNVENMSNTSPSEAEVQTAVKKVYDLDIAAIRNLSNLVGEIKNNDKLTIPGNVEITGTLTVNKKTSLKDELDVDKKTSLKDNLDVDISKAFNLLPKGTILAYDKAVAPPGWALCDGKEGRPDLLGRFILGSGKGNGLTKRDINQKSGTETHTLTVDEMPRHNHGISTNRDGAHKGRLQSTDRSQNDVHYTNETGGNQPHNNMPPYYVLTYIIKL